MDTGSRRAGRRDTRRRWGLALVAPLAALLVVPTLALAPAGPAGAASTPKACTASSSDGPVFVTATCVDPALDQPYVDVDQPGTTTDPSTGVTVSYRYVHGGFRGTNAKFAFYFPAASQYKGRFFESTYPTTTTEAATPDVITFAIANGAYVVSDNNNGGVPAGGVLAPYRLNAAASKYSWQIAAQQYHTTARPRGYLYGASGGAYQVLGAMENTDGVWDGAVPMVPGAPNAIPSFMSVQLLALRVLADKLPQIADAMAPGGSGKPYAGLDAQQQEALHEATLLGLPLRGWWQYASLSGGAFDTVSQVVEGLDPTYVDDFWSKPGYAGSDPAVRAARIQYGTTVQTVVGSPPTAVVLSSLPAGADTDTNLTDAVLDVTSGAAAGKTIPLGVVTGDTADIGASADPSVVSSLRPGDQVRVDNSWAIALEYYQRYQVPTPDEYGWNQFRNAKGAPIYPQRPLLTGPVLAKMTVGSIPNGHFNGKMIMLASTMDVQAYNWSADWYRKQAQAAKGSRLNTQYRLWWMDNADHDPGGPNSSGYVLPTGASDPKADDHVVSYTGELQEALLYLDAWVTRGTPPPASTSYRIDKNTQTSVPNRASRGGVQPAVTLAATSGSAHAATNGRITVTAGTPVTFTVQATAPPGTGKIVKVEWDVEGTGTYAATSRIAHVGSSVTVTSTHTFTTPGTYFPVVRVTAQRQGDPSSPFEGVENLASVRVVVH